MPVKTKRENRGGLRRAFRARVGDMQRAKVEGAEVAASVARQLAPVSDNNEPGHVHMKDTIALRLGSYGGVLLIVGAFYAWFVEFGTSLMDARPFFRPAIEAGREHMRRVIEGARGKRG